MMTLNGHARGRSAPEIDDRPGHKIEVYNLRYLPKWRTGRNNGADADQDRPSRDTAGGWLLAVASVLLLLLAAAQGYVSYRAQYAFVHEIKGEHLASMLEALGLDAAAVIFALLALAQARLGRPAVAERVLNLACVIGSLAMNALSADMTSAKSIAAWTLPAALYAAASDRLIAVVRRRALSGRPDAQNEGSPLAAVRGVALWSLRLVMAPWTTTKGLRAWVLDEAPVAPGRRALPKTRDLPTLPAATTPATDTDTSPDTGTDAFPDMTPVKAMDTVTDTEADKPRSRRTATGARKSGRVADKQTDKARALLAADPDMSGAELGRRLKVSERTGSRLRSRLTAELPAPSATADESADVTAAPAAEGDDAR